MNYKEAKGYIRHIFKNMDISEEMKEALEVADKAIDKQIGKEPHQKMRITRDFVNENQEESIQKDIVYVCGCGKRVFRIRDKSCPECGQRICWGDEE